MISSANVESCSSFKQRTTQKHWRYSYTSLNDDFPVTVTLFEKLTTLVFNKASILTTLMLVAFLKGHLTYSFIKQGITVQCLLSNTKECSYADCRIMKTSIFFWGSSIIEVTFLKGVKDIWGNLTQTIMFKMDMIWMWGSMNFKMYSSDVIYGRPLKYVPFYNNFCFTELRHPVHRNDKILRHVIYSLSSVRKEKKREEF